MMDRFEIGNVECIKDYGLLKSGSHYRITGSGDLSMIRDSNKTGYGYCVEYIDVKNIYYFTLNEMNEYFITEEESYKIYLRNVKLKSIGI